MLGGLVRKFSLGPRDGIVRLPKKLLKCQVRLPTHATSTGPGEHMRMLLFYLLWCPRTFSPSAVFMVMEVSTCRGGRKIFPRKFSQLRVKKNVLRSSATTKAFYCVGFTAGDWLLRMRSWRLDYVTGRGFHFSLRHMQEQKNAGKKDYLTKSLEELKINAIDDVNKKIFVFIFSSLMSFGGL